jgi:hypothetical protein
MGTSAIVLEVRPIKWEVRLLLNVKLNVHIFCSFTVISLLIGVIIVINLRVMD